MKHKLPHSHPTPPTRRPPLTSFASPRERLKNEMRQEMDMRARLAAAEAVGRSGGQAVATNVVVNGRRGRHFGILSCLLCPIIPCVMCCPVD